MNPLTLRVLSRLMVYPDERLHPALTDMRQVVANEAALPEDTRQSLDAFMARLAERELTELQEEYVTLFDRGRALSLHLFEHVHGESRDRGQAMVDLLELYRQGGLELDARELPDYLPLVLEYLSTRSIAETQELLGDAMAIVVLLGARLRARESDYALLFESLEALVGSPDNASQLREAAGQEGPDQTIVNMDQIWEEEQVTFMANQDPSGEGCSVGQARAHGLETRIIDKQTGSRKAAGSRR